MTRHLWADGHCRFPQRQFRRIFVPVRRPVPDGAQIVTAYTNGDVTLRTNRRVDGYHEAADLSSFRGVQVGDFVVHGLDILRGSIGVSDSDGAISSVCIVCEPRSTADPRFFAYAMRAQSLSGFPKAMARGVREGGADFRRWDTLGELPLPVPHFEEQRAIADYLDAETNRIDALIAKKRRLSVVAGERLCGLREALLVARPDIRWIPLHRLTDGHRPIVYGIVQAGEECPGGVPYIKTGDVAHLGSVTLSRTSPEIDQQYRRARVRPGDIVMAMRASIGLSAMVPPSLPNANLTQGTARIAPAVGIDGRWLFEALQTRAVQDQCEVSAVGTTFKTLNIWDLRRIEVPTPPRHTQSELAALLRQWQDESMNLAAALQRQIDLLIEHRQALITAAVTGQLRVPGVAA